MAPRRIRRELVLQRPVHDGRLALSVAFEIFPDRSSRNLRQSRAEELARELEADLARPTGSNVTLAYSWMRCLSSHTRNAASKSAFVRVRVPAAAMVVGGSAFFPFRPRLRERFCDFAFLTRRAPPALIVR